VTERMTLRHADRFEEDHARGFTPSLDEAGAAPLHGGVELQTGDFLAAADACMNMICTDFPQREYSFGTTTLAAARFKDGERISTIEDVSPIRTFSDKTGIPALRPRRPLPPPQKKRFVGRARQTKQGDYAYLFTSSAIVEKQGKALHSAPRPSSFRQCRGGRNPSQIGSLRILKGLSASANRLRHGIPACILSARHRKTPTPARAFKDRPSRLLKEVVPEPHRERELAQDRRVFTMPRNIPDTPPPRTAWNEDGRTTSISTAAGYIDVPGGRGHQGHRWPSQRRPFHGDIRGGGGGTRLATTANLPRPSRRRCSRQWPGLPRLLVDGRPRSRPPSTATRSSPPLIVRTGGVPKWRTTDSR